MREIKLLADERCAEALSDLLMDAGALSATIEDADADRLTHFPLPVGSGVEYVNGQP